MRPSFHSLALSLALIFSAAVYAQPDALARDFEKLSAKERARIAREEQESASQDAVYQGVMNEAESLFQALRYDEAMQKFIEARAIRPYNVYPKVKIQDLQALIAKRDAEVEQQVKPPVASPTGNASAPALVDASEVDQAMSPDAVPPLQRTEAAKTSAVLPSGLPTVLPKAKPVPAPVVGAPAVPTGSTVASEVGERVYKEGRSVVVETRLVREERIIIMRKVSHPWGEVNHFRDGIAISARDYDQELSGF